MKTPSHLLEPLEARIAPAAVFTFTDVDGDLVKITTSKGGSTDLKNAAHVSKGQLQLLDLSSPMFGAEFAGADITFTATPQNGQGDGHVNVGYINATGIDLGKISLPGDLGRIHAGNLNEPASAVKLLSVASIGFQGDFTQAPGGDLNSEFKGGLDSLSVVGGLRYANLMVTGGAVGHLGTASIGADMWESSLTTEGNLGSIKVKGSLIGGSAVGSGNISVGGNLGSVVVGGSVEGSLKSLTGQIFAFGNIGSVKIGGDLLGSGGNDSGSIKTFGNLGSLSVTGKVHGDAGGSSGSIAVIGKLGKLCIGGDLEGGMGSYSGSIDAHGAVGSIAIGGSVVGGDAYAAGGVIIDTSVSSLTIKGSLIGGSSNYSGVILGGKIGTLKIGGSLYSKGTGVSESAEIVARKLGTVTIGGSVLGGDPVAFPQHKGSIRSETSIGSLTVGGSIQCLGMGEPVISAVDSIGKITVGGSVERTSFLVGYDIDGKGVNADAQVGAVKVGSWQTSNLIVGTGAGQDGFFGTNDDVKLPGGKAGVVSKIASITVLGQASGDFYCGFVAQQIGSLKVGKQTYGFTAGGKEAFQVGPAQGAIGALYAREVA